MFQEISASGSLSISWWAGSSAAFRSHRFDQSSASQHFDSPVLSIFFHCYSKLVRADVSYVSRVRQASRVSEISIHIFLADKERSNPAAIRRFGALTSGQVLHYDQCATLCFQGVIRSSPGQSENCRSLMLATAINGDASRSARFLVLSSTSGVAR